jgi:hypothetical protein
MFNFFKNILIKKNNKYITKDSNVEDDNNVIEDDNNVIEDDNNIQNNQFTLYNSSTQSNTISSISLVNSGSGYTSGPNWTQAPSSSATQFQSDIIFNTDVYIYTNNGNPINIGDTFKTLLEITGIFVPNYKLISKYPSLNSAWEEYKQLLQKNINNIELQNALENYKIVEAIVKQDEGEI